MLPWWDIISPFISVAFRPIRQTATVLNRGADKSFMVLHLSATYVNPPAPLIKKKCADMSSQLTFPELGGTPSPKSFSWRAGLRRRRSVCSETLHSTPIWVHKRLHTWLPLTGKSGSSSDWAEATPVCPSLGLYVRAQCAAGQGLGRACSFHTSLFVGVSVDVQRWKSEEGWSNKVEPLYWSNCFTVSSLKLTG